jgi:glycosyltransferase involved in cell wall biosynthesis
LKILVSSLPDLRRVPVQRPHHLLGFLARRHDITVLCTRAWQLEEKKGAYNNAILDKLAIYYASSVKLPSICQEILFMNPINTFQNLSFLRQFDVHINFHSVFSGYLRTKALRILGIPSLFDVCDDLVSWIDLSPQVPPFLRVLARKITKSSLKKTALASSKITFTLPSLIDPSWQIDSTKAIQIPNGVNINMFTPERSENLRKKIGFTSSDLVIGFIGALQAWVDFEPLFTALEVLARKRTDLKLLIVGDGDKLPEIRRRASTYLPENTAIFTGYIDYARVPEYIGCMDICILPFTSGGVAQGALPLKIFEYLASAKPVISTPLSGVKETFGDLLFYASNSEEFRKAVLTLADNPDIRRGVGGNGRQFVFDKFDWENIGHKFEGLLSEEVARAKIERRNSG